MPAGWNKDFPLRDVQRRTLAWMLEREKNPATFYSKFKYYIPGSAVTKDPESEAEEDDDADNFGENMEDGAGMLKDGDKDDSNTNGKENGQSSAENKDANNAKDDVADQECDKAEDGGAKGDEDGEENPNLELELDLGFKMRGGILADKVGILAEKKKILAEKIRKK
jgi:hypothetical protein